MVRDLQPESYLQFSGTHPAPGHIMTLDSLARPALLGHKCLQRHCITVKRDLRVTHLLPFQRRDKKGRSTKGRVDTGDSGYVTRECMVLSVDSVQERPIRRM